MFYKQKVWNKEIKNKWKSLSCINTIKNVVIITISYKRSVSIKLTHYKTVISLVVLSLYGAECVNLFSKKRIGKS